MTVADPVLLGRLPRLAAIASLVPDGAAVADVGTGHGRLALHLAASGRIPSVVAIERSPKELAAALRFPPGDPRGARLTHRRGDGLAALAPSDGIGTAILAGLGARTILRLLDGRPEGLGISRFVLQPQTEVEALRRGLVERGYGFLDEAVVLESGRYRFILAVAPDGPAPEPVDGLSRDELLAAGPCLVRSRPPLLLAYWRARRARLGALSDSRRGETAARIAAYLERRTNSPV